jgi:CHAD domain-containing protein
MTQFYPPESKSFQQVEELLAHETKISAETPIKERLTLYDTFDWRLYENALAIIQIGELYSLHNWNRQKTIDQCILSETPQFVWDLPPGLLRATLAPLIGVRALLPRTTLYRQKIVYRVLNEDEKTVALVTLEIYDAHKEAEAEPLLHVVSVDAVRGYAKEAEQVCRIFAEAGFRERDAPIVPALLAAAGVTPGGYSIKLNIGLRPDMQAKTAANLILRSQLQIMKMNEEYIKQDIDTEFLHDYRVAVRRTRSALGQIKAVFPEAPTQRFKQDFKFIGAFSNQLRDLDVYLLAEEEYKSQLPEFLQDDIHPLFEYLAEKRAEAQQAVAAGLESAEYLRIMQDWEHFLEKEDDEGETAVNAALPVLELAQQRIHKHYRRIIKKGRRILKDNRDENLHSLRIECKKLRYLIEFFASLFPPEKIDQIVRQLKQLQNNLGNFNDYDVQETYLLHVAREMPMHGQPSRDALIAIGCLVGDLHQKREAVKSEFAAAFSSFANKENEALVTELFTPRRKK